MTWELLQACGEGEKRLAGGDVALPDIAPGETGHATFPLPADYAGGDLLKLEAYNATGDTVCTWTFPVKRPVEYMAENLKVGTAPASVTRQDSLLVLEAAGVKATLSCNTGLLVSLQKGDTVIPLNNGPLPVGVKARLRDIRADGNRVVAKYDGAIDSIVWSITPDGMLGMDALMLNWRPGNKMKESDYLSDKYHNLGLTFSYPETAVSGMHWLGRGPYRVWKNRVPGTRLGIWQKDYNNTVTSEYYYPQIYPEFKGYHADLYWATLQGEHPLTVYTATDGLFFRIFTAEEQRDREGRGRSVPEWPAGDLSFLLEIPAVNSQGADGEPSTVKIRKDDAGYHIRLWFRVGE
jgi:hypothetical protein